MIKKALTISLILLCLTFPKLLIAQMEIPILLEKASVNLNDKLSIMRGAKFFATTCMMCHSMKYLNYDPIAQRAGITLNKMPAQNTQWWFGASPPDLSLEARVRGANWLLTYLLSFYQDDSRPLGSNNLVLNNANMPNPFLNLQGVQVLTVDKTKLLSGQLGHNFFYFNVLSLKQNGTMSPAEFDQTIHDVVNFLVYASDPSALQRQQIGWWVLGFLFVLLILSYLLYKEYWKNIK